MDSKVILLLAVLASMASQMACQGGLNGLLSRRDFIDKILNETRRVVQPIVNITKDNFFDIFTPNLTGYYTPAPPEISEEIAIGNFTGTVSFNISGWFEEPVDAVVINQINKNGSNVCFDIFADPGQS